MSWRYLLDHSSGFMERTIKLFRRMTLFDQIKIDSSDKKKQHSILLAKK